MSGKNAQLSARTVTAGDEVRVIPGGHRPAIIGSINPVGELQQTGMGDGRTHVCARGLAPKESERAGWAQDQTWRSLTVVHPRIPGSQILMLITPTMHKSPSVSFLNKGSATLDCWRCCIH